MSLQDSITENRFIRFKKDVSEIDLPERLNFPFYYDPHPLCLQAASELQEYLTHQNEWEHNFGIEANQPGLVIGKMFGVLVVKNQNNEIGYLAAVSGKLAGKNLHRMFVPPIFDMLTKNSFFYREEELLNGINSKIRALEVDPKLIEAKNIFEEESKLAAEQIETQREKMRQQKKARRIKRKEASLRYSEAEMDVFEKDLARESINAKFYLKSLSEHWKQKLEKRANELAFFTDEIARLKDLRKKKSAKLQQDIFDQYHFLNKDGLSKNVCDIFRESPLLRPPGGAGECAAPKLFQYAFKHGLKPISIAEFWWGQAPNAEIRKHGNFYPACRGKCEPILAHMLKGIDMDKNPMLENPAIGKEIETIYEDENILAINKPAEFLSVPGKNIIDSVYTRIKHKYSEATGPIIVHRLDMSTSGIMLIAKTKESHENLQQQFINRTIKKRYVALLDGLVKENSGTIELPLRVDLDNRPQQLVCYEHGKTARTEWKVVDRKDGKTRIYFYPITGRTHQLRVHASHTSGLNTAIIGDDLYGKKADRLHLHAESIEFVHPVTHKVMKLKIDAEF